MQHTVELCTRLSNQRAAVQKSYSLRAALIAHLFLRVLPLPLPITNPDQPSACFWARNRATFSSDRQSALLRWLSTLSRYYAAVSLSLPSTPSFDASRVLVCAAMTAVADAVLRLVPNDAPSELALHYAGESEGPASGFAIDMRLLKHESERSLFFQPHLAAARTSILDYFHALVQRIPAERMLFRFERSMDLGRAERALLSRLALKLGFQRDEASLRSYLSGEDAGLADL